MGESINAHYELNPCKKLKHGSVNIEPSGTKVCNLWPIREQPTPSLPSERVTVRFEPRDNATEVIVVHERIASPAACEIHEQGWNGCLDGLEELLHRASFKSLPTSQRFTANAVLFLKILI